MNGQEGETNDIYLIPEGYEGDVFAFYNVEGAPEVKIEGEFEVHEVNENGYFVTSTPDMDYGTVTDRYYYVDEDGNRKPINNECIELFGTGGHQTSLDEEVGLRYTGFSLTEGGCGEGVTTKSLGMMQAAEYIIPVILKRYYGIERF